MHLDTHGAAFWAGHNRVFQRNWTRDRYERRRNRGVDVTLRDTSTTVDVTLEVGAVSEVVEVRTVAGAELQTLNATMEMVLMH